MFLSLVSLPHSTLNAVSVLSVLDFDLFSLPYPSMYHDLKSYVFNHISMLVVPRCVNLVVSFSWTPDLLPGTFHPGTHQSSHMSKSELISLYILFLSFYEPSYFPIFRIIGKYHFYSVTSQKCRHLRITLGPSILLTTYSQSVCPFIFCVFLFFIKFN